MERLSREDARATGAIHYFTGEPCVHGHIAKRYVNRRMCVRCASDRTKRDGTIERVKIWYRGKSHREKMLLWAKYRHKRGGFEGEYNLTESDLEWPEFCPALGIKFKYESQSNRRADDAPTIDRIDSSRGYVRGNVQILSRKANRIKNDGTPDEVMRVAMFMKGINQ